MLRTLFNALAAPTLSTLTFAPIFRFMRDACDRPGAFEIMIASISRWGEKLGNDINLVPPGDLNAKRTIAQELQFERARAGWDYDGAALPATPRSQANQGLSAWPATVRLRFAPGQFTSLIAYGATYATLGMQDFKMEAARNLNQLILCEPFHVTVPIPDAARDQLMTAEMLTLASLAYGEVQGAAVAAGYGNLEDWVGMARDIIPLYISQFFNYHSEGTVAGSALADFPNFIRSYGGYLLAASPAMFAPRLAAAVQWVNPFTGGAVPAPVNTFLNSGRAGTLQNPPTVDFTNATPIFGSRRVPLMVNEMYAVPVSSLILVRAGDVLWVTCDMSNAPVQGANARISNDPNHVLTPLGALAVAPAPCVLANVPPIQPNMLHPTFPLNKTQQLACRCPLAVPRYIETRGWIPSFRVIEYTTPLATARELMKLTELTMKEEHLVPPANPFNPAFISDMPPLTNTAVFIGLSGVRDDAEALEIMNMLRPALAPNLVLVPTWSALNRILPVDTRTTVPSWHMDASELLPRNFLAQQEVIDGSVYGGLTAQGAPVAPGVGQGVGGLAQVAQRVVRPNVDFRQTLATVDYGYSLPIDDDEYRVLSLTDPTSVRVETQSRLDSTAPTTELVTRSEL